MREERENGRERGEKERVREKGKLRVWLLNVSS